MTEFSESVYIRSSERADGVEWLAGNDLTGYVFESRGDWVQVFPDWNHLSDEETYRLLRNSEGVLLHYYFAEEQFWSFSIYREGALDFRYEGIWLVEEYATDGKDIDTVAELLDVSADELGQVIRSCDESPAWDELAEDAAKFADLLELPNYAYASYDYADDDAESLAKYFVGPGGQTAGLGASDLDFGDGETNLDELGAADLASLLEAAGSGDDDGDAGEANDLDDGGADLFEALGAAGALDHGSNDQSATDAEATVGDESDESPVTDGAPDLSGSGPIRRADGDAPWQGVYDLASQFLRRLDDDELIELTLDSELARDRLVERLTQAVIDNPVSRDSQVLGHWFEELMTCPEIVDVFATDAMLEEVFEQAKRDVED